MGVVCTTNSVELSLTFGGWVKTPLLNGFYNLCTGLIIRRLLNIHTSIKTNNTYFRIFVFMFLSVRPPWRASACSRSMDGEYTRQLQKGIAEESTTDSLR